MSELSERDIFMIAIQRMLLSGRVLDIDGGVIRTLNLVPWLTPVRYLRVCTCPTKKKKRPESQLTQLLLSKELGISRHR